MAGKPTIAKIDAAQAGLWWWLAREAGPTLGWTLTPSESRPERGKRYATSRKFATVACISWLRLHKLPEKKQAKVRAALISFVWLEELAGRLSSKRGLVPVAVPANAPPSHAALAGQRAASETVTQHLRDVRASVFDRKITPKMTQVMTAYVQVGEKLYSGQLKSRVSADTAASVDRMLAELRPALLVAGRYRPLTQGFRLLDRRWLEQSDPDNWALAAQDLLVRAAGLIDLATALLGPPLLAYPHTSEVPLNQDGWSRVLEDVTLELSRGGFGPRWIEKLMEHGAKPGSKNRTVRARLKRALEREEPLDGEFVEEKSSV